MNIGKLMVDSIRDSAAQVFSSMLGGELVSGEDSVEQGTPEAHDGVVSLIGLAGDWAGMGSLTCSPAMACNICSAMLMSEFPAVNEEVLDVVAELTNMIIGSVKTDLERQLGPLGLSIPTVVYGRNFKTKSARNSEWVVVRFGWKGEDLLVRLCLSPKSAAVHPPVHPAPCQSCALEM
jgi:chemotaxis protein CheX